MVVKHDFIYTPNGQNRPLHIYLPDDYYSSEERYPVMYFFDGHNLFFNEDATYGKSWGLKEFLDTWGKNMIVVGIECGKEGQIRLSEYLPYGVYRGFFSKFEPLGDETMRWIVEQVKPAVDRVYRTIPFRECTGIAGSSMGGLMAVFAAVRYNRWFSKAGCISSAIGFCKTKLLEDIKNAPISADTRVYLSWGTKEAWGLEDVEHEDRTSKTYKYNLAVANKIKRTGATVMMRCQVGGGHCEADWERLVPEFMNFLWTE